MSYSLKIQNIDCLYEALGQVLNFWTSHIFDRVIKSDIHIIAKILHLYIPSCNNLVNYDLMLAYESIYFGEKISRNGFQNIPLSVFRKLKNPRWTIGPVVQYFRWTKSKWTGPEWTSMMLHNVHRGLV
jgi:hypothetical protein